MNHKPYSVGFTLAELLISLLIIGELATFTIPKIITAQANTQYNSQAKELMGTMAAVYANYIATNGSSTDTTFGMLTPYMNYVTTDTSSQIDDIPGFGSQTCSPTDICLVLHSGAYLKYNTASSFGGTGANKGLIFYYDPDGKYGATKMSKSLKFFLYYSGRVSSEAQITTAVSNSNGSMVPGYSDPTWFSW